MPAMESVLALAWCAQSLPAGAKNKTNREAVSGLQKLSAGVLAASRSRARQKSAWPPETQASMGLDRPGCQGKVWQETQIWSETQEMNLQVLIVSSFNTKGGLPLSWLILCFRPFWKQPGTARCVDSQANS